MNLGFVSFTGIEVVYFLCALVGGLMLLLRMALMLLGVHHDVHGGFDMHHGDVHTGDTDSGFRLISVHGVTGFFLMFGLVGLALARQNQVSDFWSAGGALIAGFITMVVVGLITSSMGRLQSSGTIDVRNAIGQEGTIYLNIPEDGTGKAQVTVQEHLRIFDSVAEDKKAIKTGERIKVVDVVGGNVLVVRKV